MFDADGCHVVDFLRLGRFPSPNNYDYMPYECLGQTTS